MLKIELTDPHTLPTQTLIETATYLMKLAGIELLPKPKELSLAAISPPEPDTVHKSYMELRNSDFSEDSRSTTVSELPPQTHNPFAKQPVIDTPPAPVFQKSNIEIDCNGLPWDGRIHSRTKTKTTDGAWKLARGVDMKKVGEVTRELEAIMAIPAPVDSASVNSRLAEIPPAPVVPRPPVTQPSADPIQPLVETFTTLMNKITELVTAGRLNQAQVVKACQSAGIPSLPLVGTRPDLIPQISANIDLLVS